MNIPENAIRLLSLEGKVAIISGGASGIGFGSARPLAEFGAYLSIIYIDDEIFCKCSPFLCKRHVSMG